MKFTTGLFLVVFSALVFNTKGQNATDFTQYVNPFIGTGGHGHTYPGASVPFGMVQLSPDTRLEGWDGCSAYHASDSVIYGFSHTHLSGTGCSDYGDILFMPVAGSVNLINYGYASPFRQSTETANPGYYCVELSKGNILAELTATARVGFHRYTYQKGGDVHVVLDLNHRDKVLESSLKIIGNNEIEGSRVSQAWAQKQMVYFVARFSKPFSSHTIEMGDELNTVAMESNEKGIKSYFTFKAHDGETILVKVGISGVSIEGARANLDKDVPGWDFNKVKGDATKLWNSELGKITVEGASEEQMKVFYTALYHAQLSPNLYMDVDGRYRGRDLQVHHATNFDYYTVFSLWDTYRAAHPLFTLIDQKRTNDFINTFIHQYAEGGMLPVWELSANETGCMIGYHAVPVIADAWIKGIRGYDGEKALEAMKHSANQDHLGLKFYKSMGFIPGDQEGESVSKTLEYAFDDWCIAQMAKSLDKTEDYKTYITRAQNYKNIYNASTGFMRAKMNNTWFSPFDPSEVNFNYTEANSWQYSFYVPQDIDGLMKLHGGKAKFAANLDAMFTASSKTTGRDQADISGLIGQYAHGNEPSHHMAYLYNYAGQPWKTQELVQRICNEMYSNKRDGLCGNEDCGQMSSWYVLSAMGFYPVTPGSQDYAIGTPRFPKVTIQLENGKKFTITARNLSTNNFYIQSATLNGNPLTASVLRHSQINDGGELVFTMVPLPNKAWGSGVKDLPSSSITDHMISIVPSIESGQKAFKENTVVKLSTPQAGAVIYYTLDKSNPTLQSKIYNQPITLTENTTLKAFAKANGLPQSYMITAEFKKMPKNRSMKLATAYAGQYAAGGDLALIDLLRGGENFKTGTWQGYEGTDIDAVVDLGEVQTIKKISIGCLQDQSAWIFMPVELLFSSSTDGFNFTDLGSVKNDIPENDPGTRVKEFTLSPGYQKVRFVRVKAINRGSCPSWHPGAGQKAWIFADEITIE